MSTLGTPITSSITMTNLSVKPTDVPVHAGTVPAPEKTDAVHTADASKNGPVTLEQGDIKASFQYDQSLKQIIITLRNNNNDEVIQQFPPEQIVNMLHNIISTLGKEIDKKA